MADPKFTLPSGVTNAKSPKYSVGSSVTLTANHMPGMTGKTVKVLAAVTGTFYIVSLDGEAHKWMSEGEMKKADGKTLTGAAAGKARAEARHGKMKM